MTVDTNSLRISQDDRARIVLGCRTKLCRLLHESGLYQVHLVLNKIRDTELYQESAILYGKVRDTPTVSCRIHCNRY